MDSCNLIVNNHLTILMGDKYAIQKIRGLLSYVDKNKTFAHKKRTGKYKEIRKYLAEYVTDAKTAIIFPTGLLAKTQRLLDILDRPTTIDDKRKKPSIETTFRRYGKTHKPRYYQEEMIEECKKYPTGVIEAATGTGKSLVMAKLIHEIAQPTLVVVPSLNILKQFHTLLDHVYSPKMVGMLGGGKKTTTKPIVIATYQSLSDKPIEWFQQYKMLLLDENHHAAAETIQNLNKEKWASMYYRYYFSATPFRNDGADIALEGVIGNEVLPEDNVNGPPAVPQLRTLVGYIHLILST